VLREESTRGARRNQAALRYWRKKLNRIPQSMFAFPAAPTEQPRFVGYAWILAGFYDPVAVDGLIGAVAAERGVHFDLNVLYNDLSEFLDEADGTGVAQADGALLPEADARKLLRESVVVPESTWDGQCCKMYLAAEPGTDICSLHLLGDTAYLPLPTMQSLLLGIQTIIFEAAYRDISVADVPALTGLMPTAHGDAG
jgi:hypothetical protein